MEGICIFSVEPHFADSWPLFARGALLYHTKEWPARFPSLAQASGAPHFSEIGNLGVDSSLNKPLIPLRESRPASPNDIGVTQLRELRLGMG